MISQKSCHVQLLRENSLLSHYCGGWWGKAEQAAGSLDFINAKSVALLKYTELSNCTAELCILTLVRAACLIFCLWIKQMLQRNSVRWSFS